MNGKAYNNSLKFFIVCVLGITLLAPNFSTIQASDLKPVSKTIKHITLKKKIIKKNTLPAKKQVIAVASGIPTRFKIPSLGIDTNIESVGLTPDGAMDSPVGPIPVGWFNLGPLPGEIGNAVIDGHSGFKNHIQAAFDNLYKLKVGDKIYVTDGNGVTTTFITRKIQLYLPSDNASDVFGSSDDESHLNLITCTGVWDIVAKSHSNRLVVFSDKVI